MPAVSAAAWCVIFTLQCMCSRALNLTTLSTANNCVSGQCADASAYCSLPAGQDSVCGAGSAGTCADPESYGSGATLELCRGDYAATPIAGDPPGGALCLQAICPRCVC
jgi:hypothetical protein